MIQIDMPMPDNCVECRFNVSEFGYCNAMPVEFCGRVNDYEEDGRPEWCPLKVQEPRMMTEQEMRDAEPGAVIYCEQRDEVRTYLTPLIKYDDGVFENRFLGAEPEAAQLPNIRFWTSRPTDEQREATPWN